MIHLVSFSAVTWNFPLVGRTRMLTEAWHALGVPTTFVQVPFLRTTLEKLFPWGRAPEPIRVVRPWPTYPRRLWPHLSATRLRAGMAARARALRRQLDPLVDWRSAAAVIVSPAWTPWLDALPFGAVLYDCIDDLAVHVPRPALAPLYQTWETELIARASGAVVTAECLAANLRRRRPELPIAIIRNGVDAERFTRLAAATPRPTDLPTGRRLVGFVGALYEWLDWELMVRVAAALPELDFVFVGPHHGRGRVRDLARLPNVRLLGRRPYAQVPAYVNAFDVCWVPFQPGNVAAAANPVKLYEYLALGKPVVSTPVADLETFGSLIQVAHGVEEMVSLLRALVLQPPANAAARVAFARANSWHSRARTLADFAACLLPRQERLTEPGTPVPGPWAPPSRAGF